MMQISMPDSALDFTSLHDPARLAVLRRTVLQAQTARDAFDRLARIAAAALHAPVALVSLVNAESQVFVGCVGLPQPLATVRELPISHSFCRYAVVTREPFIVTNARVHPLVHDNPVVEEVGVIAYAGIPLVASDGQALGSFCVIDRQPREWTEAEIALLTDLAGDVMTEIELRATVAERDESLRLARITRAFMEYGNDFVTVHGRRRCVSVRQPLARAGARHPHQPDGRSARVRVRARAGARGGRGVVCRRARDARHPADAGNGVARRGREIAHL